MVDHEQRKRYVFFLLRASGHALNLASARMFAVESKWISCILSVLRSLSVSWVNTMDRCRMSARTGQVASDKNYRSPFHWS